jgi:hypothetical protein
MRRPRCSILPRPKYYPPAGVESRYLRFGVLGEHLSFVAPSFSEDLMTAFHAATR